MNILLADIAGGIGDFGDLVDIRADAGKLTLVKTEGETPANIEIVTGTNAVTTEVRLEDQNGNKVTAADGKFFTIALQLEKKLNVIGFYHSETPLTKAESAEAVKAAKRYITGAIAHALPIGHGHGPTHHFYSLYKKGGFEGMTR